MNVETENLDISPLQPSAEFLDQLTMFLENFVNLIYAVGSSKNKTFIQKIKSKVSQVSESKAGSRKNIRRNEIPQKKKKRKLCSGPSPAVFSELKRELEVNNINRTIKCSTTRLARQTL
ncbi:hypothetical protein ACTXT7_003285 [Hymenolepis weldensis]